VPHLGVVQTDSSASSCSRHFVASGEISAAFAGAKHREVFIINPCVSSPYGKIRHISGRTSMGRTHPPSVRNMHGPRPEMITFVRWRFTQKSFFPVNFDMRSTSCCVMKVPTQQHGAKRPAAHRMHAEFP
jgi:hypothetical protein